MSDHPDKSTPHYSLKPLPVSLRPSRMLTALLLAAGLGAAVSLALLPLPWIYRLPAMAGLLLGMLQAIRRYALLRAPDSVLALAIDAHGVMQCQLAGTGWHPAWVLGSSTVTPWLTVLNLRLPGRRLAQHVVVVPDGVAGDAFRQLRVWLRWGHAHE